MEAVMEFFQVAVESHGRAATIYVAGFLAQRAASRLDEAIGALPGGLAVLRVDLRGVGLIDPTAFVTVVRALSRWRDLRRGTVALQFPERSARSIAPVAAHADQRSTMGTAVSTAMTWPMSTSPG